MLGTDGPVEGDKPDQLEYKRLVFSDDFLKYEVSSSVVSLPNVVMHTKWARFWPAFSVGKIVQWTTTILLGTMYGNLGGDNNWYRTLVLRSKDQGNSWQYHASVAFSPDDPDTQLPGEYCGYCEPSMALLSDGQLLCIMRTQGPQYAGEYRPLYQCWSNDLGKTWTKPIPSKAAVDEHRTGISSSGQRRGGLRVWPTRLLRSLQSRQRSYVARLY